jgi:hypothetical protein
MFLATYWKIWVKSGDLEMYSSKSNEELPELKEVLLFMAWQFKKRQEETIVISDFWAIFFHKFPGIGQIGSILRSQFGRNLLLEESLVRPIYYKVSERPRFSPNYYKVSERPRSYIIPLKGSWFFERKCQLISH